MMIVSSVEVKSHIIDVLEEETGKKRVFRRGISKDSWDEMIYDAFNPVLSYILVEKLERLFQEWMSDTTQVKKKLN